MQTSDRAPASVWPTSVSLDRARGELQITWDDGHESRYPLALLRKVCPCATCRSFQHEQQERGGLMVIPPTMAAASAELVEAHQVGRYALGFTWKDGHSTGIYTWEYLREICPCPACQTGERVDPASRIPLA